MMSQPSSGRQILLEEITEEQAERKIETLHEKNRIGKSQWNCDKKNLS